MADPLRIEVEVFERADGIERPLAGAHVHAMLESIPGEHAGGVLTTTTRTEATGRTVVVFPTGGEVSVSAGDGLRVVSATVERYTGGEEHVRLVLTPAFRLRGRVLDAQTGAPIANAAITCSGRERLELDPVATDADGLFDVGPWEPGSYTSVDASAPGYGAETAMVLVREDGSWEIPARFGCAESRGPANPFATLVLVPEKVIAGRIVDGRGDPVPQAAVAARGAFLYFEGVLRPDVATTVTDADGRFELRGLRSDVTHAVGIEAAGFAHATAVCPARERNQDLDRVFLSPTGTLRGSIVDAAGAPVQGIGVELVQFAPTCRKPNPSPQEGYNVVRDGWGSSSVIFRSATFTGSDGGYAFRGAPQGKVRLLAQVEPTRTHQLDLQLAGGDRVVDPLVVETEIATWRGDVSVDGAPLPGARVLVAEPTAHGFTATICADAGGRFALSGFEPGSTYLVRVLAPAQADAQQTLLYRQLCTFDGSPLRVDVRSRRSGP